MKKIILCLIFALLFINAYSQENKTYFFIILNLTFTCTCFIQLDSIVRNFIESRAEFMQENDLKLLYIQFIKKTDNKTLVAITPYKKYILDDTRKRRKVSFYGYCYINNILVLFPEKFPGEFVRKNPEEKGLILPPVEKFDKNKIPPPPPLFDPQTFVYEFEENVFVKEVAPYNF